MGALCKFAGLLVAVSLIYVGAIRVFGGPTGDGADKEPVEEPEPGAFSWPHLNPPELQFSCAGTSDKSEDRLADRLAKGDPAEQLAAARGLWRGRSRRYAADVLKFLAGPPTGGPEYRALQRDVDSALRPEAVLRELKTGDYLWGTWLAFLRPHKDLVPALLDGLKTKPDLRAETVLALGNSGDPRVLDPLLAMLKSKDYREAGEAAQALGYLGDPKAEAALIAALADDNGWRQVNACGALAKLGTKAALPTLMKVADSKEYTGALNIRGVAMQAVVAVERREHVSPRAESPDGPTPKLTASLRGHGEYVWSVAFGPDGKALASASDDKTVRVWDPAAGTALAAYAGHARQMTRVRFVDRGTVAAAGWGDDGSVRLLDARTGKVTGTLVVAKGGVDSMTVSPDGRWLAASGGGEKERTQVWDVGTGKVSVTLPEAGRALAFSPDGKVLATMDVEDACAIRLWSVPDGKPVGRLKGPSGFVGSAAFSPDGRILAAGAGWRLRVWDVAAQKETAAYRCDDEIGTVVFHPDGRRVVTTEGFGPVRLWDLTAGKVAVAFPARGPAALSPDGKVLATGSTDGTEVLLWTVPDSK